MAWIARPIRRASIRVSTTPSSRRKARAIPRLSPGSMRWRAGRLAAEFVHECQPEEISSDREYRFLHGAGGRLAPCGLQVTEGQMSPEKFTAFVMLTTLVSF